MRYEGGGAAVSTGGRGTGEGDWGGGGWGGGWGAGMGAAKALYDYRCGYSSVDEFITRSHCGPGPCSWLISSKPHVASGSDEFVTGHHMWRPDPPLSFLLLATFRPSKLKIATLATIRH